MPRRSAYESAVLSSDALRAATRSKDGIRRNGALLALGQISEREFWVRTGPDWQRLGEKLWRAYRTKLPETVHPEDLAQEMRLEAARLMPAWDPSLRTLGDFLVWNAYAKARKWLNKQRNAEGQKGSAPSRLAIPASRLSNREPEDKPAPTAFDRAASASDQDERAAAAEAYRRLRRGVTDRQAASFFEALERAGEGRASKRDWRVIRETYEAMGSAFEALLSE